MTTRRWLRLFLYASLADVSMAPAYIATILTHTLDIVAEEALLELRLKAPDDPAERQELAWMLHGTVSHLAIRRHIYGNANPMPVDDVIAMHVRAFLGGLQAMLAPL